MGRGAFSLSERPSSPRPSPPPREEREWNPVRNHNRVKLHPVLTGIMRFTNNPDFYPQRPQIDADE